MSLFVELGSTYIEIIEDFELEVFLKHKVLYRKFYSKKFMQIPVAVAHSLDR